MKKIQFWIALWAGKLFLWVYKATGHARNDKPGMASMLLCSDFLKYIAKPKLTIAVSGTNGKTSITIVTANLLKQQGMSVSYNDWGANHHAGQARCLLDAVNIFNHPTKDAAVIESDELISPLNIPKLKPQYLIVTNLARDSMERNAHPEYIAAKLQQALDSSPETIAVLNADDPLSCFMGSHNRRIFFGVHDLHSRARDYKANDFTVCPRCGASPVYHYRNYRHIGDFECPKCGLKSPQRDYFVQSYNEESVTVREPAGTATYPILSPAVHNIYNLAAIVAMFRDMGVSSEQLAESLHHVTLPADCESHEIVNGIELITQVTKGQNPTASSTVFEYVSNDNSEKEVVLLLDEIFEDPNKTETIAWIYDTDYEFLRSEHIHKIVVGGERYLDHKLRLLLAGIPSEKIACVRDFYDTPALVDTSGISKIFILHDVNSITRGRNIRDLIKKRICEENEVVSK